MSITTVLLSRRILSCSIFLGVVSLCSLHQSTNAQSTTAQNMTAQNMTAQNMTAQNMTAQSTTAQNMTAQNMTAQNMTALRMINSSSVQFGAYQLSDQEWHRVLFKSRIANPIVVVGPPSYNNKDNMQLLLNNVTESGFDVRMIKYGCASTATVVNETTSWIAVSSGLYKVGQIQLLAGKTLVTESTPGANLITNITFPVTFFDTVAMTFIQHYELEGGNVEDIPHSRVVTPGRDGISIVVEKERSQANKRMVQVGYIIFEPGTAILDGRHFYALYRKSSKVKQLIKRKVGNFQFHNGDMYPLILAVSAKPVLLRLDKNSIGKDSDLIVQRPIKCQDDMDDDEMKENYIDFMFIFVKDMAPASTTTDPKGYQMVKGRTVKQHNNVLFHCYMSQSQSSTTATTTTDGKRRLGVTRREERL